MRVRAREFQNRRVHAGRSAFFQRIEHLHRRRGDGIELQLAEVVVGLFEQQMNLSAERACFAANGLHLQRMTEGPDTLHETIGAFDTAV